MPAPLQPPLRPTRRRQSFKRKGSRTLAFVASPGSPVQQRQRTRFKVVGRRKRGAPTFVPLSILQPVSRAQRTARRPQYRRRPHLSLWFPPSTPVVVASGPVFNGHTTFKQRVACRRRRSTLWVPLGPVGERGFVVVTLASNLTTVRFATTASTDATVGTA